MACYKHDKKHCGFFEEQPLRNSNAYLFECHRGRNTLCILNNFRFEILCEMAATAFVREEYDSCVARFYTAFERFEEVQIKIILYELGITEDAAEGVWKRLRNSSVMQAGAAAIGRAISNQNAQVEWPEISRTKREKLSSLRNKVVHDGFFPSREQTISFADDLLKHL